MDQDRPSLYRVIYRLEDIEAFEITSIRPAVVSVMPYAGKEHMASQIMTLGFQTA
jgi:hypothetical protein